MRRLALGLYIFQSQCSLCCHPYITCSITLILGCVRHMYTYAEHCEGISKTYRQTKTCQNTSKQLYNANLTWCKPRTMRMHRVHARMHSELESMRKCQQSPEQAKTAQLTYWRRADAEAKLMDRGTTRMTQTRSQMCKAVAEIRKWLKMQVEKSECIRGQETKTCLVSSKAKLQSVPGDGVTLVSTGIMDMHHKNELINPLGM